LQALPPRVQRLWIGPFFAQDLSWNDLSHHLPSGDLTLLDLDLSKYERWPTGSKQDVALVRSQSVVLPRLKTLSVRVPSVGTTVPSMEDSDQQRHPTNNDLCATLATLLCLLVPLTSSESKEDEYMEDTEVESSHEEAPIARQRLEILDIRNLSQEGVVLVANHLLWQLQESSPWTRCPPKEVILSWSCIGDEAASALATVLRCNWTTRNSHLHDGLEKLDLSFCSSMDDEDFALIVDALSSSSCCSLKELNLVGCSKLTTEQSGVALLHCLQDGRNMMLEKIALQGTSISDSCIAAIEWYLRLNRAGRQVALQSCFDHIPKTLPSVADRHCRFPPSLWPLLLEKVALHRGTTAPTLAECNREICYSARRDGRGPTGQNEGDINESFSILYYFVRHGTELWSGR